MLYVLLVPTWVFHDVVAANFVIDQRPSGRPHSAGQHHCPLPLLHFVLELLIVQGIHILALVSLVEVSLRTHADDLSVLRALRAHALNSLLVLNVLLTASATDAQVILVV